jgi:hypothetical protein
MVMLALPVLLSKVAVPATTLPPEGNCVEVGVEVGAPACAKPAKDSAATKGVRWNRFMARVGS